MGLAPITVLPKHQNQGISPNLVTYALAECGRLGHQLIIVIGHQDYYPRFGFTSARAAGIDVDFEASDEVFMVMALEENALENVQGKVKFDKTLELV